MPTKLLLIDPAKVKAARLRARCPLSSAARSVGVPSAVIGRLETGGDQRHYTLELVSSVARTYGVAVNELLVDVEDRAGDAPSTAAGDAATVGAVLVAHGQAVSVDVLAEALTWPLERTLAGLHALEPLLAAAGQRLARFADSHVAVVSAPAEATLPVLTRRSIEVGGLSRGDLSVLHRIIGGSTKLRSDAPTRTAIARLINAGLCSMGDEGSGPGGAALTDEGRFNLVL